MKKISLRSKYYLMFFLLPVFVFALNVNASELPEQESRKSLTVLFTHDLHDHLLPVKDERNGQIIYSGGLARLQSAISSERNQNSNVVLVDAGDFSMGTPFQTIFQSDSPELRIMGEMGYDAATFGNHEFDYRASGLAASLNSAFESGGKLPQLVQANMEFPADDNGELTSSLAALQEACRNYGVRDYTIIERGGIRIGIFGLMGVDSASKAPMSEVRFTDPIINAKRVVKLLKEQEKSDLIICLSHTGTWEDPEDSEDEILAKMVPEIDIIISGHTHTKLSEPIIAGKTIIGSAEDSCRYLGVINIKEDEDNRWQLDSYRLQTIDDQLPENYYFAGLVNKYKQIVQEKYFNRFGLNFDQIIAISPFSFNTTHTIKDNHREDPLGNLISDAYIYAVQQAEGAEYIPVDAAIVPVGTIRSTFFAGDINAGDVFNVSSLGIGPDKIPGYPLLSVYLTGEELKNVCEVDASVSPIMEDAQLFISGVNFTFNPNRLIFNKVTFASLVGRDGKEEEIEDQKLYRVVAGLYSAQMLSVVGEKSFGLLSIIPKTKEGIPIQDFEAQIIRNNAGDSNSELKEWQAIAEYLQSFEKVNGVPQIPPYYNEVHGRKVVDLNPDISAVLSKPNKIALGVYSAGIGGVALVIFISMRITLWRKRIRREQAMRQLSGSKGQ